MPSFIAHVLPLQLQAPFVSIVSYSVTAPKLFFHRRGFSNSAAQPML
jgi:hypothetical protein